MMFWDKLNTYICMLILSYKLLADPIEANLFIDLAAISVVISVDVTIFYKCKRKNIYT